MLHSHGRGGAGNMADDAGSPHISIKDLQTPTLKTSVITTGRGGSGNMARNTDPIETRMRQDVEPVIRRSSSGAQHAGRGGAGNVFRPEEVAAHKSSEHAVEDDHSSRRSFDFDSLATKGKQILFGKK